MEVPPNNSDDENNPNKKLGNFKIKLKIPKQPHHQNPAEIHDEDELEEGEIREDQEEGEIASADDTNANNGVIKREIRSPNQDQGVTTIQAGLRVCPLCGKGFSSGKALGGHMRVHAEPSPNHRKKLKTVPGRVGRRPGPIQDPSHQQVFKCDICPKEFWSPKSLFGHMRSHPERGWRGMNPPPDLTWSGPSSPSPGPDTCPDPVLSLREIKLKWKMRGKRKQKGQSSSSSSSSEGGGQQVDAEVAATDLMLILAGGERNTRVKEKEKGKTKVTANNLEYDSDEAYYLKNMGYLDSDDCDTEEDEGAVEEKAAIVVELQGDDHKVMMRENRSGKRRRIVKGKRIRVLSSNQKLDDQIQGEVATSSGKNINFNNDKNSDGKWRCNTCSKTFPTHQALGGHRSSHNKEKNLSIQINHHTHTHTHTHIHIHTRAHVDLVDGSGLTSLGLVSGDKTFPSDQSEDLEGQHYAPPCEASSSSPGQSSCQTGRRDNAIEFDLNEAPLTMLDEGEEEVEGDVQSHLKFFS